MADTAFIELLKSIEQPLFVLSPAISVDQYIPLDLSIHNPELEQIDVSSSKALESYIWNHIIHHHAKVAYGGYIEQRGIYNRSNNFNLGNPNEERNIHLGLDLWIEADTPIYAPLDTVVHSFANNTNYGDYGPTIILEHTVNETTFYTLYGHLSLESIAHLKIGQKFQQGEQIATLGDASVNGDYAPHLHFQIIKDLQSYKGDYPGVCRRRDLEFYKQNCPDPNILLELP
ncbi:MAG: peptidoglycan DD-metalloendopeptidase family protein [Bacteroidota bacterium]